MIKRLVMALMLCTLAFCGIHQTAAYAFDPYQDVCSGGGGGNSAVCTGANTKDPLTGNDGLIIKATNLIAFIAGTAAIIVLIIGGIRYISSGGDAGNVESAKNTIVGAIIGLIVIALARTIVAFVVTKI
jgi:hypothetical protein